MMWCKQTKVVNFKDFLRPLQKSSPLIQRPKPNSRTQIIIIIIIIIIITIMTN